MKISFLGNNPNNPSPIDWFAERRKEHYESTHRQGYRYEKTSVPYDDLMYDKRVLKYIKRGNCPSKTRLKWREIKNATTVGFMQSPISSLNIVEVEREIPVIKDLVTIYFKKLLAILKSK